MTRLSLSNPSRARMIYDPHDFMPGQMQLRLADPNASLLALYGDLANAGLPHLSDEKTSDISPRTTGVTSEYTKSILIERLLGSNAYLRYVGERVDMYTEKKKKKSQDK